MRRLATVAPLVLLAIAWGPSLCAQHGGGGHGGFSGHSAPSFHGGFSGSGPAFHGGFSRSGPAFHGISPGMGPARSGFRTLPGYNFRVPWAGEFNGRPLSTAGRPTGIARGFARTTPGSGSGFAYHPGNRMPYRSPYRRDHDHDRNSFYGNEIWPWWLNSYGYLGYPDFYDYPPWWDYDDSDDSQGYNSQGYLQQTPQPQDYGPQPQDYGPQPGYGQQPGPDELPPWPSMNAPQNGQSTFPAQVTAPAQPAQPVTLVFNDGRPAEKIHNYLITSGTLYVMDEHRQDIPVAALDLAATAKINRQAGVEFNVPGTPK